MNTISIKQRFFTFFKVFCVAIASTTAMFGESKHKKPTSNDFRYVEPFSIHPKRAPLGSYNTVTIVQDKKKNTFVIKSFTDPEQAIHEALGAYIGIAMGIRINKVRIIPAHMKCVGKAENSVGTIHTCMPGEEVEKTNIAQNISIRGGLISYAHLQTLVVYDELCSIVALDIFLDNFDRHNGNLFFDKKTNHFYAIDMDRVYSISLHFCNSSQSAIDEFNILHYDCLAVNAYNYLITLDSAALSSGEKTALNHMRDWLNKFLNQYPSVTLYNLWMNLAQEAVYVYVPLKKVFVQTMLDYNCLQVQRVVTQIDTLVLV